mmetsp:Transcript_13774/g.31216  ORF Transcript_13774/g.31216 Transcript_13774/m.31216 type:complete len:230 (+) Transcript_13774:388-1077(+)
MRAFTLTPPWSGWAPPSPAFSMLGWTNDACFTAAWWAGVLAVRWTEASCFRAIWRDGLTMTCRIEASFAREVFCGSAPVSRKLAFDASAFLVSLPGSSCSGGPLSSARSPSIPLSAAFSTLMCTDWSSLLSLDADSATFLESSAIPLEVLDHSFTALSRPSASFPAAAMLVSMGPPGLRRSLMASAFGGSTKDSSFSSLTEATSSSPFIVWWPPVNDCADAVCASTGAA